MIDRFIIDTNSKKSRYLQLYDYFRNKITTGEIKKDDKLPSIRSVCQSINVSRTTVESAYSQLLVEGYIESKPKSGYYVAELNPIEYSSYNITFDRDKEKENYKTYLNNGVDKDSFDVKNWRRYYSKVITDNKDELHQYVDNQGEYTLREEICKYVKKTRGVVCSPEQIVIGAGVQYLLGMICSIINNDNNAIAIEDPGFSLAKNVFEDYRYKIFPVSVDDDGINILELDRTNARVVYISPSHQFPTGSVMPIGKRLKLLEWANKNNSIIIEDDYDCLIRYETKPIPSLQGLDGGIHVVYLGSFSKLLIPSIRISYMILPQKLLNTYNLIKKRYSQSTSKIEQLTLALFMKEGCLEKHIRKIRKIYYRKNQQIIKLIETKGRDRIKILGKDSGLHLMLEVITQKTTQEIIENAEKEGILLETVENSLEKVLVFTYSGIEDEKIDEVITSLLDMI